MGLIRISFCTFNEESGKYYYVANYGSDDSNQWEAE